LDAEVVNTDITDAKSYQADAIFTSPQFVSDLQGNVKVPLYPIQRYSDKEEIKTQIKALFQSKS
jgi:PTS system ascorbate-specific IIB component